MSVSSHATAGPAGPVETTWAAGLLLLGAVALASAYRGWLPLLVLGLVAVLGVLLVALGRLLRLGVLGAAVTSLALLVLTTTMLLRAGSGAEARPWTLVVDAVPRLLTGPRPAPDAPDLLAPAVLLVGLVTVLVGVRLRRHRRARVSAPAGGLVLYVAAAALTGGAADRWGLLATGLVVVTVLGWGLLDRPAATGSSTEPPGAARPPRGLVASVAALAAVAVPVVVGPSLLDRREAFDPREVVDPPVTDLVVANPMPLLDAWARDPERELFTVRGAPFPLHLAVLSEYDGASWSAPSAFRPLGDATPTLAAGDRQARVDADVTLVNVPPPWLPAPGAPESVDLGSALLDVESGTVVDPRASSGTRYTVVGLVDAPEDAAATGAGLPDPEAVPELLATPGLPGPLREYATTSVEGTATAFARAKAIEAAVRGTRTFDPSAPGGSSYRRLSTFLLGEEDTAGAQRGGSEQFASAFAVLARAVGLPTRVVVGFTPGSAAAGAEVRTVRGEDALAWPEVYLTGAGWVPFSPTPDVAELGPDIPDQAPIPSAPPTPQPVPSTAVTVDVAGGTGAVDGPDLTSLLLAGAAVVLLAALPALVLALLRARRRAGHRRAGAAGAWSELLDVADLARLRSRPGQDPRELALALDARSGAGGAAHEVVTAAESERWAPDPLPPRGGGPVWQAARSVERDVRRRAPWSRRLLWSVDPGPLRRPRRKVPSRSPLSETDPVPQDDCERWAPVVPADRRD